jgi:hypothetical protein
LANTLSPRSLCNPPSPCVLPPSGIPECKGVDAEKWLAKGSDSMDGTPILLGGQGGHD